MILSMTGFGRGTAVLNGREITVELRSVNSRYFEYSSRIPRTCSSLDSRLKKQLNERVTRGKVELSMTIQNMEAADAEVTVNMELARSYQKALRNLSEKLCIKNDYVKEYWGEGSNRAQNWQRYDMGGTESLKFEEGVDSYVPYAGKMKDNLAATLSKIKATMCSCGAVTIPDLQQNAKITLVSSTSIVEGGAHDVILKEKG